MTGVLVTGANGFVGSHLISALHDRDYSLNGSVRSSTSNITPYPDVKYLETGDLGPYTEWFEALSDIDAIIHLAARVHVMHETARDPLDSFRQVNVQGSLNLASQAKDAGVKRFIYVSSIKVNGERTLQHPYTEYDTPEPMDPYALSKLETERLLIELGLKSDMEVVIVRPPLVYGPGVGGNFKRLMQLVQRKLPLPLASIQNARSMISVHNLTDFLIRCLEHPRAAGETFLVADGIDWSTPDLIRLIAREMGVPAHLFPFPLSLLQLMGRLAGQGEVIQRLCDSLVVDISKAREYLDWIPPQSPDTAVQQTVDWYLRHKHD